MVGFDIIPFIKSAGYLGIFAMILLENGVPLLFFLPGDTLLLTAGFLAAQGILDIKILLAGGFVMAILGYMLGYYLGHRISAKVFSKGDTHYIKLEHLEKTRAFYDKYGSISLLLARFLPLRACVCFLAGSANMNYGVFMLYNVLGAFAWAILLPLCGYFLGTMIPIKDLKMLAILPIAGIVGSLVLFMVIVKYKKAFASDKQQENKENIPE